MDAQEQIRKPYPSDLSESQWLLMVPLLPTPGGGRTRTTDLREVLNAVLYLFRTGCGWRQPWSSRSIGEAAGGGSGHW